MSKQTDRISQKMKQLGACYAHNSSKHIGPNDPGQMYGDSKPTYHIMPDASQPYQSSILRFDSLRTLEGWLDTAITCEAIEDEDEAARLMAMFWENNY